MEQENQTDLGDINCIRGLRGAEELLSSLGLFESQPQMKNNENQNAKSTPFKEILAHFIKFGFKISLEGFFR